MSRPLVASRPIVANRMVVRDFGTAISNSTNSITPQVLSATGPLQGANGSCTISMYLKPSALSGVFDLAGGGFRLDTWGGQFNLNVRQKDGTYLYYYNVPIPILNYSLFTLVCDAITQTGYFYLNGDALPYTVSLVGGLFDYGNTPFNLMHSSAGASSFLGSIDNVRIWKRALTASEVSTLFYSGTHDATGLSLEYLFNEGAGTTANDTSGNGNNGTITGATYTDDVPVKPRPLVGGNLIPNGDFSMAPPFTAATTYGEVVVDGTASGASIGVYGSYPSEAKKIFHWKTSIYQTTTGSVQYDPTATGDGSNSIKCTGTNVQERVHVHLAERNYSDSNNPRDVMDNFIPVLPSTSYTMTARIMTDFSSVVGTLSPSNGAVVYLVEQAGIQFIATHNAAVQQVTQGWTDYTYTFTTGPTSNFINVSAGLFGSPSAYLSGSGWFAKLRLQTTLPTTRPLV